MSKALTRRATLQAAAVALLGTNACKDGCKRKAEGIKVGVILTLSGPQGGIGKELQQGLKLALETVGGRAGGRAIQLVERDDKNDPQAAVEAAKDLIEKEKVDLIIGPSHTHVMLQLRNIIHESKTILLNPNAGASLIAGNLCSPYIFTTGRMNPLYAETLGRYMAKKDIKTVALLASNFAAGVEMVQGFKDSFVGEGGGKIVEGGELLPPLNTTDFGPYLAQLKGLKADAVFAFFAGEMSIPFIKQYAESGLKARLPLYVTGYTVEQDVLNQQGDSALGILSVSVYSPMLDNDANKKYAPAYKEKYGTYPSEYSVLAYDAGQLLAVAVDAVGGKVDDKVALMSALSSAKIDSPRGPFKLGPNHTPVQNAYLREVKKAPDGKLVNTMVAIAWPNYYFPGDGCTLPGATKG
jgi:branched-chain amino acid transport system substrate-binding protein